jgi:hypothetical protein
MTIRPIIASKSPRQRPFIQEQGEAVTTAIRPFLAALLPPIGRRLMMTAERDEEFGAAPLVPVVPVFSQLRTPVSCRDDGHPWIWTAPSRT